MLTSSYPGSSPPPPPALCEPQFPHLKGLMISFDLELKPNARGHGGDSRRTRRPKVSVRVGRGPVLAWGAGRPGIAGLLVGGWAAPPFPVFTPGFQAIPSSSLAQLCVSWAALWARHPGSGGEGKTGAQEKEERGLGSPPPRTPTNETVNLVGWRKGTVPS